MKIEGLHIRNYKGLKDVRINNLPQLCVFIGRNGSGKSTFFDVFRFLGDALRDNVQIALNNRGGFGEVITRDSPEDSEIFIEVKFRNNGTQGKKSPLITYSISIGAKDNWTAYVKSEVLQFKKGSYGAPYKFINFKNGEGDAIVNEKDFAKDDFQPLREKQILDSPDILAIKGLGQFTKFPAISLSERRLRTGIFLISGSILPEADRT
jgi:predicted ATPase